MLRAAALATFVLLAGCSTPEAEQKRDTAGPCPWMAALVVNRSLEVIRDGCGLALVSVTRTVGRIHETLRFAPPLTILSGFDGPWNATTTVTAHTLPANGSAVVTNGTYEAAVAIHPVGTLGPATRQWASAARDVNGPVPHALGAPDALWEGTSETAWVVAPEARPAWIEVDFERAVVPHLLRIWQAETPAFIARIEAWDTIAESWRVAWEGIDLTGSVPGFLDARMPMLEKTDRFRIHVADPYDDRTHAIDAVELIGAGGWTAHMDVILVSHDERRAVMLALDTLNSTLELRALGASP